MARLGTCRPLALLVGLGVSRPSAVHGVGCLLKLLSEQVGIDPVTLRLGGEEVLLALLPLAELPLLDLVQLALTFFLVGATLVDVRGCMLARNGDGRTGSSHVAATGEVGEHGLFPGAAVFEHEHADPVGVCCQRVLEQGRSTLQVDGETFRNCRQWQPR